jgi:predicted Zn finger-like uncharacterized protein
MTALGGQPARPGRLVVVSNPLTDRVLRLVQTPPGLDSPMLIVCPSCASSYDVEPAVLEPNGRQVRCVRCRTVWHAESSRAERLLAAAAALAPADPEDVAEAVDPPGWSVEPAEAETGQEAEAEPEPQDAEAVEPAAEASEPPTVEAPPIAPVDLDAGRPPIDIEAAEPAEASAPAQNDVESYAARFSRRTAKGRRPLWSLTRLQTAILALLIIDAVIVGWRRDIVRVLPQTASFYALIGLPVNLRGLVFDAVTSKAEQHEGVPILVVEGAIVNRTGAVAEVPSMKLAVRNAAKQEIYAWTAASPRATLAPYQAVAFRTRLASPPPESADVLVRFINRRDIVAAPR